MTAQMTGRARFWKGFLRRSPGLFTSREIVEKAQPSAQVLLRRPAASLSFKTQTLNMLQATIRACSRQFFRRRRTWFWGRVWQEKEGGNSLIFGSEEATGLRRRSPMRLLA